MIDILRAVAATFTVDTTPGVLEVAIVPSAFPPASLVSQFCPRPGLTPYFDRKDNFIIESLSLVLPHSFCCGSVNWLLRLQGEDAAFNIFDLPVSGYCLLPFENSEIDIGQNIPFNTSLFGIKWGIVGSLNRGTVSMVNVPTSLNTVVLNIWAFAKVRHTLPMVA
jgi:hypothetical protein